MLKFLGVLFMMQAPLLAAEAEMTGTVVKHMGQAYFLVGEDGQCVSIGGMAPDYDAYVGKELKTEYVSWGSMTGELKRNMQMTWGEEGLRPSRLKPAECERIVGKISGSDLPPL